MLPPLRDISSWSAGGTSTARRFARGDAIPRARHHNYGRGVATATRVEPDAAEIKEGLLRTFRAREYVPPVLPKVGLELISLTRSSTVEIPQVVHLLEQDALIAAAVLRQAQSAYYARGAPIRSLHEAIVRLGLDTIGDLFLARSMAMRVFRAEGYEEPMHRLCAHGTATAHIARLVCRETAIYDEYAFLCGLLHDVGMAASLIALAPGPARRRVPPFDSAWPVICDVHQETGAALCALWELPKDVAYVIRHHHGPQPGDPVHPLAAVICVAEGIASEIGFGMDGDHAGDGSWAAGAVAVSAAARARIAAQAAEFLRGTDTVP